MLSVESARRLGVKAARYLSASCLAAACLLLGAVTPVGATTTIDATVRDNLPVSLTITTAINGKTVTLPTVTIEGTVHNVTQIIVYVDGEYSTSLPLAAGADTFTVAFGVTPGAHSVRIVGHDAYTNTDVSETVSFSYVPAGSGGSNDQGENEDGDTSPVNQYVNDTIDAANATKDAATDQIHQASSSGPLSGLIDGMYGALNSMDLVSATDGSGLTKMGGRFTMVASGLALSIFPTAIYSVARRLEFIARLAISHAAVIGTMRLLGVVLIIAPFFLIR